MPPSKTTTKSTPTRRKADEYEARKEPKMIRLRASALHGVYPYRNAQFSMVQDEDGMPRMTETKPGAVLRADDGVVFAPEDDIQELIDKGVISSNGPLWFEDDPMARKFGIQAAPTVKSGMVQSVMSANLTAPISDWDEATAEEISEYIEAGDITDLQAALAWETSQKVRPAVIRVIADAIAKQAEEPEDLAAKVG